MSKKWQDFPELVEAKKQDILSDDKIDSLITQLKISRTKKRTVSEILDEAYTTTNKNLFGYISKSTKQILSSINSLNQRVKRKSSDSDKLAVILENQKLLAALVVKIGRTSKQLNEIVSE